MPIDHETAELKIPGLRAHMGDWVYYATFLKMRDVAERVSLAAEIHKSDTLKELIQREVESAHKESIRNYLLRQKERFFNALVVGVYGGSPRWVELSIEDGRRSELRDFPDYIRGALGILILDGSEKLFAIDGQHRVVGIKAAVEQKPVLGDDEITAIFVAHGTDRRGMQRTRRLFTTLNRYAKPVSKMQIIALDEDDVVAIITRRLVDDHRLFRSWTSIKKGKNISQTDHKNFTTIVALYDALDRFLSSEPKTWREFKKLRPTDSVIAEHYNRAVELWDAFIKHFEPLRELVESQPSDEVAFRYRSREGGHLLFRPVGLYMVVAVVRHFLEERRSLGSILRSFREVPMFLSEPPWVGLLWDTANRRMTVSGERQKVALRLLYRGLGGDLSRFKTNDALLRNELAGLLLRNPQEVALPLWVRA